MTFNITPALIVGDPNMPEDTPLPLIPDEMPPNEYRPYHRRLYHLTAMAMAAHYTAQAASYAAPSDPATAAAHVEAANALLLAYAYAQHCRAGEWRATHHEHFGAWQTSRWLEQAEAAATSTHPASRPPEWHGDFLPMGWFAACWQEHVTKAGFPTASMSKPALHAALATIAALPVLADVSAITAEGEVLP